MTAYVNVFSHQKAGNSAAECEDASWPGTSADEQLPLRIAAADGATDAVFSGLWAKILVNSWGRERLALDDFATSIERKARVWRRLIKNRHLPWYVEEKAQSGSFAALAAVELHANGIWNAVACGDCCLFQIRGQELIASFPISESREFSNSPVLLSTGNVEQFRNEIRFDSGRWESGDHLYLMTDALACWFLGQCECGRVPWKLMTEIALSERIGFADWIADLRKQNQIKNDDCTLVSVTLE